MAISVEELRRLAADLESDRVERTISTTDTEKVRQAICAFANDMPAHRQPGYLIIGVADDGTIPGATVTDQLLLKLADRRSDGHIQPMPTMAVYKLEVSPGVAVAVVEVQPSDAPPVRASGRTWIRVGPRKATASAEEERRLSERRVASTRTFDQRPCAGATLADLLLDSFRALYLPKVVAAEVLAQNQRTTGDQLASLRFLDPASGRPTNAGVLLFGLDPMTFIPGAYIQFVRFDGADLADPVLDSKRIGGNLLTQLQELNSLLPIQIRSARGPTGALRHESVPDYPLAAVRELVLNAVMHRSYEATNAPVRINWFSDRIEIQNPGGLFGQVTPENFGRVSDYRNFVLAEAMSVLGYVDKFGTGVARARASLVKNGNPSPDFTFESTHVQVTVRVRS